MVEQRVKCVGVHIGPACDHEIHEHSEDAEDDDCLEPAGFLHAEGVDQDEEKCEDDAYGLDRDIEEVQQVPPKSHESKCCLEDEREPDAEARHCAHERTHRPVDEQIGPACLWHGCRHFGLG